MCDETRRPRREGAGSTRPELEGRTIVTCSKDDCSKPSRSRGLCEMHYARLKRAGLGQLLREKPKRQSSTVLAAQRGENQACVDCGGEPLFGGLRCLRHFQSKAQKRRGEHVCLKHAAGITCYQTCRCRCQDCRDVANEQRKRLRNAGKVAA